MHCCDTCLIKGEINQICEHVKVELGGRHIHAGHLCAKCKDDFRVHLSVVIRNAFAPPEGKTTLDLLQIALENEKAEG